MPRIYNKNGAEWPGITSNFINANSLLCICYSSFHVVSKVEVGHSFFAGVTCEQFHTTERPETKMHSSWSWSGMESDVDKLLSITLEELVIGRLRGFWHSTWVQEMEKQNPESLKYRVWFFRTGVFLNIFSHNFALYLCRSSPRLKIRPVYYYFFFSLLSTLCI